MEKQLLLKRIQYSIPSSSLTLAGNTRSHLVNEQLPLMKVQIDFEKGALQLEGDWYFLMVANAYHDESWLTFHRDRVLVKTAIYPAFSIDLNDSACDGLIFPLEGTLEDGSSLSDYSGLLVLESTRISDGVIRNQWNITCYLYDSHFDESEIKFQFPVYIGEGNKNYN